MKKLSLLIALFMCLTIGGVYATWSYAGTNDIADVFAEAKVTIADVELVGANGTYKIETNFALLIDQANTDHEAELKFVSNDSNPVTMTITFTPADNAPQTIKDNAVPSELYFGVTTEMKYEGKNIFKFSNESNGTLEANIDWGTANGEGKFVVTYDETALKKKIMLNDEGGDVPFVLDTKAEHDTFREALKGNIVARVTDGTVTTDAPAADSTQNG